MSGIEEINLDQTFHAGHEEAMAKIYERFPSGASLTAWAQEHQEIGTLAHQKFHYLYDRPTEWSGNVVVAGGEFANGIHPGMLIRALIVREVADPHAALLIQPNSTVQTTVHNFSRDERHRLANGNPAPLVDRLRSAMQQQEESDDPERNTLLYGPSQGAVAMAAYAAHPDTERVALAVIEAPNTQDRNNLELLKDFGGSGKSLKDNIQVNFVGHKYLLLYEDLLRGVDLRHLLLYVAGGARPENVALRGVLRQCTLTGYIEQTLGKGSSVVQAWGIKDRVSGDDVNTAIAEFFINHSAYQGVRVVGEHADHSITNRYGLNAHIAKMSIDRLLDSSKL